MPHSRRPVFSFHLWVGCAAAVPGAQESTLRARRTKYALLSPSRGCRLHSVVAAALITISGILPAAALIESLLVRLVVLWGLSTGALLAQSCPNVAATPSSDYGFLIGSAVSPVPAGSLYQWLVKGQPAASGHTTQLFLLHADGNAVSTEGIAPLAAKGVSFAPGRWGSALTVANGGALSYQRQGTIDFNEGSIEMWIAPLADGSDPTYSAREHALFYYQAPNKDYLKIAQSNSGGILYGGGATNGGQWESAYAGSASMSSWSAGVWHHIAFTFSASGNFMRFYLDGVLTADTNEKHYIPPDPGSDRFYLGQTPGGTPAAYLIDEVRIWSRAMTAAEVAANATTLACTEGLRSKRACNTGL